MTINKIHPAFKNVIFILIQIVINYYLESVDEIKRITEKNMPDSMKREKICEV